MKEGELSTEQENIVRYWHAVETLQPQSAPKPKRRSDPYGALILDTPIQHPALPWTPESDLHREELPNGRVWSHTLFAYLYDSRLVAGKLKQAYGSDQGYREPQYRESALFAAKFTMAGHMVERSFVLCSEAWFLGRVLTGKDWTRGFEDDQRFAGERAQALLGGVVSGDALRELTQWVLSFLGVAEFLGHMDGHVFRFRSQPVRPDKPESEDDPLNSFLLDELADVAASLHRGETSAPLDQYLRRHDAQTRLHVDDDSASLPLIDRLMPDVYASSCWPSERHLGLVHSQQLAVNTILSTLGSSQGLLGINGPPGTGKTTLLRDLIAAIVGDRADALAKLRRASDGFVNDGREEASDGGRRQTGFKLNPALYGFEIVIASANNGAVENVTLELPQRDKIDESWLPEAEYFAELGELITGKPAWGLISGALGSKSRRTQFVDRYFHGQRPFEGGHNANREVAGAAESGQKNKQAADGRPTRLPGSPRSNVGRDALNDMPASEGERPQGLREWLNAHVERNRALNPMQRQALWQQAVSDYETAKAEARKACAEAVRIRGLIGEICQVRRTLADESEAMRTFEQKRADVVTRLSRLDAEESPPAQNAFKRSLDELKLHHADKPGFWTNLLSLGRARREWNAKRRLLEGQRDLASAEFARLTRLAEQLDASRRSLEEQITNARRVVRRLRDQAQVLVREATSLATLCQANHLLAWLQGNFVGRGDAIELTEPWHVGGWRQARARVFVQALKLHRTFFELEASRMRSNLFLINGLLTGTRFQGFSPDAIRSAWASLFMVVPVLSSTFASFARSFGSLGVGEIGWLLVDEAGQAPPQAAVGALWRSTRAVLVGDPLQLKPIVTVSDAVLEHMRTRYRVEAHWLPNRQSAQTLADEATPWGRMAGPAGNKTWVGLPLVVHRRCDKPMHELANRIAYDGAMVYGTLAPRPDKETRASLQTGWIQASGPSQGNWVPAEGEALQELLALLLEDGVEPKDISVITPFTDVRNSLKRIVDDKMVFGTIHTMQGKEAPVVVMVLGGSAEGPGARNWVVSEPNLLNVAATRAKRRFYVIGDRNDWKNRVLFCDVMDLLPLQELPLRELKQ